MVNENSSGLERPGEGGSEGGREGAREGGSEGGRERGREGRSKGRRKGGRDREMEGGEINGSQSSRHFLFPTDVHVDVHVCVQYENTKGNVDIYCTVCKRINIEVTY